MAENVETLVAEKIVDVASDSSGEIFDANNLVALAEPRKPAPPVTRIRLCPNSTFDSAWIVIYNISMSAPAWARD